MKRQTRKFLLTALLIFPIILVSIIYVEDIAETSRQSGERGTFGFMNDMIRQVAILASQAGYFGIFGLMFLESLALPVPSEMILPFAGFLVSQGKLEFWPVIFYTTLAALVGSLIDYYIGFKIGGVLLKGDSRLPFINVRHLREVERLFKRHGAFAVAGLRMVPAARVLISFPAGAYRMGIGKFVVLTLAGCLPWNILLVYLGVKFGDSWTSVVGAFRYINLVVYALLVLLTLWLVWRVTSEDTQKSRLS